MEKMSFDRDTYLYTKTPNDYFLNYHDKVQESEPPKPRKHVPQIDIEKLQCRDEVSYLKKSNKHFEKQRDEKRKQ